MTMTGISMGRAEEKGDRSRDKRRHVSVPMLVLGSRDTSTAKKCKLLVAPEAKHLRKIDRRYESMRSGSRS